MMLNSFYYLNDVLGKELLSTLLSGPAIFTSSDRNYVDYLAIKETATPTIVPYKAHYRLEDFAWLQADKNAHPRARTGSVMFHGSVGRGFSHSSRPDNVSAHDYEEGQLRLEICDRLGPELAGNSLRCVRDIWKLEQGDLEQMSFHRSSTDEATDGSGDKRVPAGRLTGLSLIHI